MPDSKESNDEKRESSDNVKPTASPPKRKKKHSTVKQPESENRANQTKGDPAITPTPSPEVVTVASQWMQAWLPIILNGILLILVFAQAVIYHRQWTVMQEQVGEMRKSTTAAIQSADAATKAAKAAEDSLAFSKENARVDQRAWITVDAVSSEPSAKQPTGTVFKVVFKNTGKTPALKVNSFIRQSETPEDIPKEDPPAENPVAMILGPNAIGNTSTADNPIPAELAHAISIGKLWYVSGTIWYADIFGKPHWTQFAFRVGPDFKTFGPIAVHNGCDDWGDNGK